MIVLGKMRIDWKGGDIDLTIFFSLLLSRVEKHLNFVLLVGGQALVMLALITQFPSMVLFVLPLS